MAGEKGKVYLTLKRLTHTDIYITVLFLINGVSEDYSSSPMRHSASKPIGSEMVADLTDEQKAADQNAQVDEFCERSGGIGPAV